RCVIRGRFLDDVGDFVQAALGLSGGDDAVAAHLVLGHAPCGQHGGAGLVIRLDQLSETRLGAEDDVVGQKGGARLVAYQPAAGPDRVPQPARPTLLDVSELHLAGKRAERGPEPSAASVARYTVISYRRTWVAQGRLQRRP